MFHGNGGGYSNYTRAQNGDAYDRQTGNKMGLPRGRSLYLYIAGVVAILFFAFLFVQMVNTSLIIHFGMLAGVLLLLANLREFLGKPFIHTQQANSIALLNSLVGASLLMAWLSQVLSSLFWIPALLLMALATPLVLTNAPVYTAYVQTVSRAVEKVRSKVGRL